MRSVDPEHRRARADERVEGHDGLVGMLGGHALHHVDLGADGEHRSRRRRLDPFEDALGRPDAVGDLDDLVRALGVDDHLAFGMLGAERFDVLGPEPLVHGAVALPQQEGRVLDVALLEPAEVVPRIPDAHVGLVEAHLVAGVPSEVLVGEEEHLVAAGEGPIEDGLCVRARAHRAAVLADEGLQRGGRVHVRDRHDPVDVGDARERLPALLDLVEIRHVGHRAARVQVGEDDALVFAGEDVGRLGHEVHAAEDDVGGVDRCRPRNAPA